MRIALVALSVVAVFLVSTSPVGSAEFSEAQVGLADVQSALGGAAELARVEALIMKGVVAVRNGWFRPGTADEEYGSSPVEVQILLPDHYVRVVQTDRGRRSSGFAGQEPLGVAPVAGQKRALAYLALPMLPGVPLLGWTLAAEAGNALRFQSPEHGEARLEIDSGSKLPVRLHYELQRTGTGGAVGGLDAIVVELGDYREAGALKLAHRIGQKHDGILEWEYRFDAIVVNPPTLTAASFDQWRRGRRPDAGPRRTP